MLERVLLDGSADNADSARMPNGSLSRSALALPRASPRLAALHVHRSVAAGLDGLSVSGYSTQYQPYEKPQRAARRGC
jgi:hypothetical protein